MNNQGGPWGPAVAKSLEVGFHRFDRIQMSLIFRARNFFQSWNSGNTSLVIYIHSFARQVVKCPQCCQTTKIPTAMIFFARLDLDFRCYKLWFRILSTVVPLLLFLEKFQPSDVKNINCGANMPLLQSEGQLLESQKRIWGQNYPRGKLLRTIFSSKQFHGGGTRWCGRRNDKNVEWPLGGLKKPNFWNSMGALSNPIALVKRSSERFLFLLYLIWKAPPQAFFCLMGITMGKRPIICLLQ